jgi:RNA recognition motif-containing protein
MQVMQERKSDLEIKQDPNALFVHNLDYSLDERTIVKKFSEFGRVTGIVLPYMHGKLKGYAWVLLDRVEDAQRALDAQKEIVLGSRPIFINVSLRFVLIGRLVREQRTIKRAHLLP